MFISGQGVKIDFILAAKALLLAVKGGSLAAKAIYNNIIGPGPGSR